jgi:hypothetical protein
MAASSNFPVVFEQLKQVLQRHADQLVVQRDEPTSYLLITTRLGPNKQPLYFGSVEIKKNYVSFHLVPVYMYPDLLDTISPALMKRMQGKSCFNFKTIDQETLTELAALTERGFEQITKA